MIMDNMACDEKTGTIRKRSDVCEWSPTASAGIRNRDQDRPGLQKFVELARSLETRGPQDHGGVLLVQGSGPWKGPASH